jgi:hypothetical protein
VRRDRNGQGAASGSEFVGLDSEWCPSHIQDGFPTNRPAWTPWTEAPRPTGLSNVLARNDII